jgi:mannose-1-phosphate guanylyltransferase
MSDSSDKEETTHLTTPRSTQGSNEKNLSSIDHGSIDYVCMEVSQSIQVCMNETQDII